MEHIQSYDELISQVKQGNTTFLLLYKGGSDLSQCALKNISKAKKDNMDYVILLADVNNVKDIHGNYGVKTVPSLLAFQKGEFKKVVKGCNSPHFYRTIFENIVNPSIVGSGSKTTKDIIVYSTPSCPWCKKLKRYLKQKNIQFQDIDVSKNQNAAKRMVNGSGQKGVPQTEINGQFIVGFDKRKIDKLLNIN